MTFMSQHLASATEPLVPIVMPHFRFDQPASSGIHTPANTARFYNHCIGYVLCLVQKTGEGRR